MDNVYLKKYALREFREERISPKISARAKSQDPGQLTRQPNALVQSQVDRRAGCYQWICL